MKKTDAAPEKKRFPRLLKHAGIRVRVFFYLAVFSVLIILLLAYLQLDQLDWFYQRNRENQVREASNHMVSAIPHDVHNEYAAIYKMAQKYDVAILLLDEREYALVSQSSSQNSLLQRLSSDDLSWLCRMAPADGSPVGMYYRVQSVPDGPASGLVSSRFSMSYASSDSSEWYADNGPAIADLDDEEDEWTSEEAESGEALDSGKEAESTEETGTSTAVSHKQTLSTPTDTDPIIMSGYGPGGPPSSPASTFNSTEDAMLRSYIQIRKVTLPDGRVCTLMLNTEITPVLATRAALSSQLTAVSIIVLVLAAILALIISSIISRPIQETNRAAKALSHSRYTPPPQANRYREIAELNQTLVKAAEDLSQVDNLQHELIANISHDLRTPLTMIGGYAEVMRDLPSENTPENMQMIIDETARLSSLVNELLDFSRLQAGVVQMSFAPFNLTSSVQAIISRINVLTASKGYKITFEQDQNLYVNADQSRIEQVLYNLIGNALTYTGESKSVTVRQTLNGDMAHIDVIDTGKGIAEEELDLIWNRYYRTRETHKRAVVGSGLGLHIVQTILEQHHVPYGVRSTLKVGTTFWFELPIVKDTETPG